MEAPTPEPVLEALAVPEAVPAELLAELAAPFVPEPTVMMLEAAVPPPCCASSAAWAVGVLFAAPGTMPVPRASAATAPTMTTDCLSEKRFMRVSFYLLLAAAPAGRRRLQ